MAKDGAVFSSSRTISFHGACSALMRLVYLISFRLYLIVFIRISYFNDCVATGFSKLSGPSLILKCEGR